MIHRDLSGLIKKSAGNIPILVINGPRQSGKTTLVKNVFSSYNYVNLERPDIKDFAKTDPLGFLKKYNEKVIFDEIQNVPELFSYIQPIVDEKKKNGLFILTGSQNFLLSQQISQTLSGRTLIYNLLPLSINEIKNAGDGKRINIDHLVYKGFYPRLYDSTLEPFDWYQSYIQTYIERDVRQLMNIGNIGSFNNFMKILAGRNGQILNYVTIGNELSVSYNTIKNWVSVLEQSFIIFLLRPYYKNLNKRVIKSPKVYFYDSGIVCSLLGIRKPEEVGIHFLKGSLFEGMIIADMYKEIFNNNLGTDLYFWRDSNNNEIDCLYNFKLKDNALEIKSGETFHPSFLDGIEKFDKITNGKFQSKLIYGGDENFKRNGINVYTYTDTKKLFK